MNERIAIDPEVHHGQPVIRGTRVPVARILGGLAGGMTEEEILAEYDITEEDMEAIRQRPEQEARARRSRTTM